MRTRRRGTEIDLEPGRWLCNPGSVGQPRDGDWRAAWLLLDLDARRASFRRVRVRRAGDAGGDSRRGSARLARRAAALGRLEPRRRRSTAARNCRSPPWPAAPYVMPSRASASCTSSRALWMRHFTVASVTSRASAISEYGKPTTSRSSSAILRSGLRSSTARQSGVDRLQLLDRCVEHLQRRDVVDGDEAARPALVRSELVEDAVLRHLEEPRRELAAQGELREALEDAEEDLLREILGERAVVDEPQHVVVDRRLVRPDDDREGSLVTPLSFAEDRQIGLRERQGCVSIAACSRARRPRKAGITAFLPGIFPS